MANLIKELQAYNGGHILNDAMVEYRNKQANQINSIIGVKCYNVLDDKSINDKANVNPNVGLAERILKNDFRAMQESDIYIFDVLNEGLGTISEMSILLGMKHQAQKIIDKYDNVDFRELDSRTQDDILEAYNIINKPVLCYCSDIRQGHHKPYNDPDRAEFSTNQFIFGVILELTNGEGFITWEEVLKRLEELGNQA